jgi:DNA-binding response OmpR family regulator
MTAAAYPRPLVLLVDDTAPLLRVLQRSLERHELDVLIAPNAAEAIALMAGAERRVDLAVLDLELPDMGGEDLARELRRASPTLRVLYTSGYVDRRDGSQLGDPMLRKPFVPQELAWLIVSMLPNRRRRRRPDDTWTTEPPASSPAATVMAYRIVIRPEHRSSYPEVPAGWLAAHRRAGDDGAFWLDVEEGQVAARGMAILEPHVEVEAFVLRGPTVTCGDERTR